MYAWIGQTIIDNNTERTLSLLSVGAEVADQNDTMARHAVIKYDVPRSRGRKLVYSARRYNRSSEYICALPKLKGEFIYYMGLVFSVYLSVFFSVLRIARFSFRIE